MKSEVKYRISSNKFLFCYLLYAIVICLNDFLIFMFSWEYLVSLSISGILVLLVTVIYVKKNRVAWEDLSVNVYDAGLILLIILQCTLRAVMPDTSYDTLNYHLYYQKFFDRDFIHYDFFPMRSFNAQTFGAISDRLFYGFRYFLGYRMGTLLNTFVVILIYFQTKQLFIMIWREFGHDCKSRWSKILGSAGAFICLMTENTYTLQSTYMVDYLAVPFLLEIIRLVINMEGRGKEETDTVHTAGYLCLMSGFAIGIKITNILVIVPLAIYFLIKQRKNINIKCFFWSALMLAYPLALYLFISYRITGNPMFPYFNGFFKSPYFSTTRSPNDFSAFNNRFDPVKVIEFILWPLYMLKFPERTADYQMCSGRVLVIVFVLIIAIFCEFKRYTHIVKINILYCIYCYVLFLTILHGYMRYVPVLEILGSAIAIIVLVEWLCNRGNIMKLVGVIGAHFLITQIYTATSSYIMGNCEWAWRDIKDVERIVANLPYVFRDYSTGISGEILDDIQCWVVPGPGGSLAAELKSNVPIIGINPYFAITSDYAAQYLEQRLEEVADQNIYSVTKISRWEDNFEIYNSYGLALKEIMTIQPNFWDQIWCLPLMELETVDRKVNLQCESFTSSEESLTIDIGESVDFLDIFVGDAVDERKTTDTEYQISAVGINQETGEEQVIFQNAVVTQMGRYIKATVDVSGDQIDQIEVRKVSCDADQDAGETFQVVIQEYLK